MKKTILPRKKAMPRSKATNAYDLLEDVKRVILAEPKRLNMGYWFYRSLREWIKTNNASRVKETAPSGAPGCGTVGCVAGWITLLAGGQQHEENDSATPHRAAELLGQGYSGFLASNREIAAKQGPMSLSVLFSSSGISGRAGSLAYAKRVAARITQYQSDHYVALKSKAVNTKRAA